jgi:hypothetical protein
MQYYTYAYLREDRTPYYIGKGQGNRAYVNHYREKRNCISIPKNSDRILILKQNLTEAEAFRHEIYMISVFGRKDLGTGILHNRTNGGEGSSGDIRSEIFKQNLSKIHKGKTLSEETKKKISLANKGNQTWLGKNLTDEHKKKCAKSKIGNTWNRKKFKLTFDDGKNVEIYGLRSWCRENNYSSGCISAVLCGKRKRHKDIVAVEKLDTTS